jgi:signal transduction histidine kinase/tetratricopeptide (TPR) repeat protein
MKRSAHVRGKRLLDSWIGKSWRYLLLPITMLKTKRNEVHMAVVLLALIILPSGLLGYFSWRAIGHEQLLAQERLRESYRHFALLAAREIDETLKKVEKGWIAAVQGIIKPDMQRPAAEDFAELMEKEPLIAASFLLTAPGTVAYPPDLSIREESASSEPWEKDVYIYENDIFNKLVAQSEELEYRSYDLDGALAGYHEILSQVSNLQLRGTAESYIGRVLLKKGDRAAALATFQQVLAHYPEIRDPNKMSLRFLAQYQIAVCLESLGRDQEAIEAILHLHQDLLERSDTVNTLQYVFFLDQIRPLAARLLTSPKLSDPSRYQTQFHMLSRQNKKRISQKYFLQLLDRKLNKMVVERKYYKPKFHYISDTTDDEPYLLAYHPLPDASGISVIGLLGVRIDLAQLRQRLFPRVLQNLKFSEQVALAVLNTKGDYIIGTERTISQPIAVQTLDEPFDFWRVAVYLGDSQTISQWGNFYTTLGLWLISLLFISILLGAYIFVRRAWREAYLSQMKSTFVSNVSHELRTPLASIKMLAELLDMQLTRGSTVALEKHKVPAEQYLSVIRRECDRLGRLIENLLAFARIERGMEQYHFEYEDPAIVVRMAVESFRPHAEAQGFRLDLDIVEPLPDMRLDADAIVQVVLNLLSNAVKYSDAMKDICVRVYCDGSQVAVEVTDCGIGIDVAEVPKIFDDFYRVDQRLNTQKQGGMGLGLTLVRHIVRAHGGRVSVHSEVGKGSTFVVTLPIPAEEMPSVKAMSAVHGDA